YTERAGDVAVAGGLDDARQGRTDPPQGRPRQRRRRLRASRHRLRGGPVGRARGYRRGRSAHRGRRDRRPGGGSPRARPLARHEAWVVTLAWSSGALMPELDPAAQTLLRAGYGLLLLAFLLMTLPHGRRFFQIERSGGYAQS